MRACATEFDVQHLKVLFRSLRPIRLFHASLVAPYVETDIANRR
jgi:hypothetical protein